MAGKRLNSYPNVSTLSGSEKMVIDGNGGTKNINMNDLNASLQKLSHYWNRRFLFRGKTFNKFDDSQKAAILNGTFDDLFVNDCWFINNIMWRIVDMNYWYGQGDISCITNHLVIMPDTKLYAESMNNSDTTEGGYVNSKMRTEGIEQAKEIIFSAFGEENILVHREYLFNAVTDGHPSGGIWVDSTVEIPSEIQMYGSNICSIPYTGTSTIDKSQLSAMSVRPYAINPYRQSMWLRDVASDTSFSYIHGVGTATAGTAANSTIGVRPVFALIGG